MTCALWDKVNSASQDLQTSPRRAHCLRLVLSDDKFPESWTLFLNLPMPSSISLEHTHACLCTYAHLHTPEFLMTWRKDGLVESEIHVDSLKVSALSRRKHFFFFHIDALQINGDFFFSSQVEFYTFSFSWQQRRKTLSVTWDCLKIQI